VRDDDLNIKLDGVVISADGETVGTVKWVIVDLRTDEASGIVVQSRQDPSRFVVLDIADVELAEEDHTILNLTADEFQRAPNCVIARHISPLSVTTPSGPVSPPKWKQPAKDVQKAAVRLMAERKARPGPAEQVAAGESVTCIDGLAGPLHRVLLDDYTNAVTQIVIGKSPNLSRDTMVPYEWVVQVNEEGWTLNCRLQDLESLPPAPTDLEL